MYNQYQGLFIILVFGWFVLQKSSPHAAGYRYYPLWFPSMQFSRGYVGGYAGVSSLALGSNEVKMKPGCQSVLL